MRRVVIGIYDLRRDAFVVAAKADGHRDSHSPGGIVRQNENLWDLAAGPGGAVWAVGDSRNNAMTKFTPLSMVVWNGTTWRKVAVTAPAGSELSAVTFVPGGKVWAGGSSAAGRHTLIVHWTGKAWSRVAIPDRFAGTNYVNAVAATSSRDAWAVGAGTGTGPFRTLILHWNGSTWR